MDQRARPAPRLAPLPLDHNPDLKDAFADSIKSLGFVPNSMLIMQRKPKILSAFRQLSAAINADPQSEVDRGFKRLLAHVASRAAGCRYCMAACPFTAKVYNWGEPQWIDGATTCFNPDVSRRMVGVVEKCSFCAHRLIKVKEDADQEERAIRDGEYVPACMENCPADAIYFGDIEDKQSMVHKLSRNYRAFRVMEDLGVEPKLYYLSKRKA